MIFFVGYLTRFFFELYFQKINIQNDGKLSYKHTELTFGSFEDQDFLHGHQLPVHFALEVETDDDLVAFSRSFGSVHSLFQGAGRFRF